MRALLGPQRLFAARCAYLLHVQVCPGIFGLTFFAPGPTVLVAHAPKLICCAFPFFTLLVFLVFLVSFLVVIAIVFLLIDLKQN